ncbi:MAG: RNA-dependent RNA polymerase [Sanya benyvirus 1]|nr:MAG: RNA-dependent RNA polymerase [Sanya benyvirus 1]
MDVQTVIDTATAANAATLGSAEASQIFREQLKSSIKVHVNLTSGQKQLLRKMIDFQVLFVGGKNVTNDHPVPVAIRDICRNIFESEFKISVSCERVLIVGASAREIAMYNSNPHIHYYVHGKENKDYDRTIRTALQNISRNLRDKASKKNRTIFCAKPENETCKTRPIIKRYQTAKQVLDDYMTINKLPGTIHTELVEANTLVFEDSFYNFTPEMWIETFMKTGARVAYGYGLLPMELLFPDMPANPLYSIHDSRDFNPVEYKGVKSVGNMAYLPKFDLKAISELGKATTSLVFRHGYCNGYVHDTYAWSTLLRSPVIECDKYPLKLAVEITSRAGPAVVFKVYRCDYPERIARMIELTPREQYVRVLDLQSSVNKSTGKVNKPLRYFSVREDEFCDTYNYCLALDPKSLTFPNVIQYIRRRMGGMSLITKELVEPWYLQKVDVEKLALNILIYVKLRHGEMENIMQNIDVGSVWEKVKAWFRATTRMVFLPIAYLIEWIMAGNLVNDLVLYPDGSVYQYHSVDPNITLDSGIDVGLYADHPNEEDIPDCPVCLALIGRLGLQEVICEHKDCDTDIGMTQEEIDRFQNVLCANDNDPSGLKSVKERCLKSMPKTQFSRKIKVRYIEAGPGCGKSYMIRQLAGENDLVLAPFSKLRPDYMNLHKENGETYDLNFKTQHRAMETRGCRRIFVDEFTSLPYEYLACVINQNAAEEVYLVGDIKQTKVRPEEGIYIGDKIDLSSVSKHTLVKNFRNPKDTVALLNKIYGYKMEAMSNIEKSIEFVGVDDIPRDITKMTRMAFTKASAEAQTESADNTVRANQGGTCVTAILYVTSLDHNLPDVTDLQIVGLSRHTDKLYIVHDNCEAFQRLYQKLELSPEFYEHMQTWLTFPKENIKKVTIEDMCVPLICKPQQPPRDSYKLIETFIPSAAFDDIQTSMNLLGSHLVGDQFNSGRVIPDMIIMPTNKRNHPVDLVDRYFSISSGVGNHFSGKKPVQTLQVLQSRYLNKQPFYPYNHTEDQLATKIVDLWFAENVKPNMRINIFDNAQIEAILSGFVQHITSRHYQEAFSANGGLDNNDGRVIRFQLKGIFKPKHGSPDPYKAGQGISAWSTDACAMFCSVFRVLNNLVVQTEKDFVLTDSYKTELEFIDSVNMVFKAISPLAQNAVTDGVTFDANQNKFTQMIEKKYWRKYGVADEFLEHYYSFRKDYKIISTVAIGYAGTQKTSGEPGTLANNGVVSKCISNYQVRGEGDYSIVYKGDDFCKRQLNLKVITKHVDEVNAACALSLRVDISDSAEFCGLLFAYGHLFPSIPRRLNKLSAHRFKTYKHFCEYQCSIRDCVNNMAKMDENLVIALNSVHYKTKFEEMREAYHTYVSYGHINLEQFYEMFQYRSEPSLIPIKLSSGSIAFYE